jgi:hypothetical protein
MLSGLSKRDIAAMPPFPFPKELFPAGTFPEGMRFSREGLEGVPPSVEALLGAGDGAALGAMFAAATTDAHDHMMIGDLKNASGWGGVSGDTRCVLDDGEGDESLLCALHALAQDADSAGGSGMEVPPELLELLQSMPILQGLPPEIVPALLRSGTYSDEQLSDSCSSKASKTVPAVGSGAFIRATAPGRVAPPAVPQTQVTASCHTHGPRLSESLKQDWFMAAKLGNVPALNELLQRDPALCAVKGPGVNHTALHWAAAKGHIAAVAFLLRQEGADVNVRNACDSTPLHTAAANGQDEVVRALLQQIDCDRNAVNEDNVTAWYLAQQRGHLAVMQALEESSETERLDRSLCPSCGSVASAGEASDGCTLHGGQSVAEPTSGYSLLGGRKPAVTVEETLAAAICMNTKASGEGAGALHSVTHNPESALERLLSKSAGGATASGCGVPLSRACLCEAGEGGHARWASEGQPAAVGPHADTAGNQSMTCCDNRPVERAAGTTSSETMQAATEVIRADAADEPAGMAATVATTEATVAAGLGEERTADQGSNKAGGIHDAEVFWSAKVAWSQLITRDVGSRWMAAARAGQLPVLMELLQQHKVLLVFRGRGTSFGFCGAASWTLGFPVRILELLPVPSLEIGTRWAPWSRQLCNCCCSSVVSRATTSLLCSFVANMIRLPDDLVTSTRTAQLTHSSQCRQHCIALGCRKRACTSSPLASFEWRPPQCP